MIQVVSYPPSLALARVPSQGSPRGICVGKSGTVKGLCCCVLVSPSHCHSASGE